MKDDKPLNKKRSLVTKKISDYATVFAHVILSITAIIILLVFLIGILLNLKLTNGVIFNNLDKYVSLTLNSWPAVILVLGIILLLSQPDAISNLIKRIKQIGRGGIELQDERFIENGISNQKDSPVLDKNKETIAELKRETTGEHNKTNDMLATKLAELEKSYTFEGLHNRMFGTQILLMQKLFTNGFISNEEARSFYEEAESNFLNYSLSAENSNSGGNHIEMNSWDYINGLEAAGLISINEYGYSITDLGKEFIDYVNTNQLSGVIKQY